MILVGAWWLWCSLSVQSAGPRIEVIRFSLLIVLTVALLSVAFRIHSHPSSSAHGNAAHPRASASPGVPTRVLPSESTRPAARHPRTVGGSGSTGGSPGTTPAGSDGGSGAILPVTGWDATLKLGALAFVFIGGGTLCVRAGGPRRQRPDTVHD
jgi:hypothetical protein